MIELDGEYYDGVTTISRPARLTVYERTCRLRGDGLALEFQVDDLKVSAPLANLPRRLSWGDAATFVVDDSPRIAALTQLTKESSLERFADRLERVWPVAVIGLVLVAFIYGAVLFWGVPAASKKIALGLPDSVLDEAAEQALQAIDKIYLDPSELPSERQAALRAYLREFDDTGKPIEFRKGGQSIGANAFALVGGYIVFTDELIELAEDDREVLAVYLHEVGHARNRHAETAILQNASWLVLLTLVTGDVSGVSSYVISLPLLVSQLAFSRELETDADTYAIDALLAHGISPHHLADMLEKMIAAGSAKPGLQADQQAADRPVDTTPEEQTLPDRHTEEKAQTQWSDYFSTHPAPEDRINRLRAARLGETSSASDE